GPGVTDGVTGVANAYLAGSPILVIGGAAPLGFWDRGALQEMNQIDLLRPITKWARTVHETSRLAEYTAMAFRQMLGSKPGPAFRLSHWCGPWLPATDAPAVLHLRATKSAGRGRYHPGHWHAHGLPPQSRPTAAYPGGRQCHLVRPGKRGYRCQPRSCRRTRGRRGRQYAASGGGHQATQPGRVACLHPHRGTQGPGTGQG